MADDSNGMPAWQIQAGGELASQQAADGGWPYVPGQTSATEPTALALMALTLAAAADFRRTPAADWLAARQRGDGMFAVSPAIEETNGFTATAALAMLHEGRTASSDGAARALLDANVATLNPLFDTGVYGYDTRLRGWPWTPGDFSLTEPTCLALIFLKKAGHRDHPRVREAAAMLRDRAIRGGGWNYGEPRVWGGDLFPCVADTAMALVALADEQDDLTAAGLAWLQGQQGAITSLTSLGWAAISMNVLGLLDDAWRFDVIGAWGSAPSDRRGPAETALCLLGLTEASDHPFKVLP